MPTKIILSAQKQQKIIQGHPWVFPQAIQKIIGEPHPGDWVLVYDSHNALIGAGFFNPHSLYRVRMIANASHLSRSHDPLNTIKIRLEHAFHLRKTLGFPNEQTNCYRLCNSEADGLSGLVMDVLNDKIVISSSALWVEQQRQPITHILQKHFPKAQILWFGQSKALKQDGIEHPYRDDASNIRTIAKEEAVLFEIGFENVQKTGIFIDQRENHHRLASLCKGKKVLDLYTYHGGFALHAALNGAASVTAIDSSAAAIEHAKHNASLNQVSQINWIVDDAKNHLDKAQDYDVVILDPPKLVPSKKHLNAAKNLYRFLHRQVFKHLKSGSILMTCNCSSALNTQEFIQLVSQQAIAEGQSIQILGVYGPAICHPVLAVFPEGNYLTAILLAIM